MHHREWSDSQYKAASLFALGATSNEVGIECDLSRSQIRYLKKLPEFTKLVMDIRVNIKQYAIEETRNIIEQDIRAFRRDFKLAANNLQEISAILLEKLRISAELIDPERIGVKHLPAHLRACTEALSIAMSVKEKCLSLDKIMEMSSALQSEIESRGLNNIASESLYQRNDSED